MTQILGLDNPCLHGHPQIFKISGLYRLWGYPCKHDWLLGATMEFCLQGQAKPQWFVVPNDYIKNIIWAAETELLKQYNKLSTKAIKPLARGNHPKLICAIFWMMAVQFIIRASFAFFIELLIREDLTAVYTLQWYLGKDHCLTLVTMRNNCISLPK